MPRYPEVGEKPVGPQKQFPKDVVSISCRLGNDWEGEPTMFFDIVLSEEARRSPHNPGRLGNRLSLAIRSEV